jgi:iron(III) transport system ATP-binding protein
VSTPPAALALEGVTRRFSELVVVDDLDLEVAAGSLTALLGPSGCGKTTTLRLVAGLDVPDAGTIAVHGTTVAGPGTFVPPERRRIGLVFQDHALFPHLSVVDNIAFGLDHLDASARRARCHEMLELVGLDTAQGARLPSQLSGGQQQRVALARALAPEPRVLLLDEPFSNLDAGLRASVREEVRAILAVTGTTAVVVTHDQTEALSLADKVAVMDRGRLHQLATPHELYAQPATRFVAEFVGDALTLPGRRAGRWFVDTALGRLETVHPVHDHDLAVMIRPEEVLVRPDETGDDVVRGVTYYGHDQVVTVARGDLVLEARMGPTARFHPGDRVRVDVAGAVTAFPADDPGETAAAAPPAAGVGAESPRP